MKNVYIPFAFTRSASFDILGVYSTLEAAIIAAQSERYSYAWIDIEETQVDANFQEVSQVIYRFEDDEEYAI